MLNKLPCPSALFQSSRPFDTVTGDSDDQGADNLYRVNGRANMTADIIYKICAKQDWQAAEQAGVYTGAAIDHRDGFIHFSAAHQVAETLARHFAGQKDLLLIAVKAAALGGPLRWEPSRGGDLFPHLYGSLALDAVVWTRPLPLQPDGSHRLPGLPGLPGLPALPEQEGDA